MAAQPKAVQPAGQPIPDKPGNILESRSQRARKTSRSPNLYSVNQESFVPPYRNILAAVDVAEQGAESGRFPRMRSGVAEPAEVESCEKNGRDDWI